MEQFVTIIALVGLVIVVASLLSGAIERTAIPLVAVFLALGAALGPWGFGLLEISFASPELRVLATLALALVLFSDAVTIDTREVRIRQRLAWRVLGPGTLVPAALIGVTAWLLLGVSPPAAAILGAALASTDPVLLRTMLRSPALPPAPRVALRLESGMNDVALLPIVAISSLLLLAEAPGGNELSSRELGRHLMGLFLLGPALGATVGYVGIVLLGRIRDRVGVRRDYESMYALGLAFTGYAAAEAVGGSGFLAAFAAGFIVASQDVELCDCFLEYGEATAEMLLLLTFVALGTSLIWTGLTVISFRTLAFAVIALFIRTLVLYPMLRNVGLTQRERKMVALFGPRGLSTLLFMLIPVFAGVPGAEALFTVACLVTLLSVIIHGGGMAIFLRANTPAGAPVSATAVGQRPTLNPPSAPAGAGGHTREISLRADRPGDAMSDIPERIDLTEVREIIARSEPVIIVDARKDRNLGADPRRAVGSIRLPPDDPVRTATEQRLSQHATLVVYCA
jgi:NhaP-type Na+/H+ or K+/H+ antiporter